jgi:predicted SnoaL-like aldol condensation-catalyzing enzyme
MVTRVAAAVAGVAILAGCSTTGSASSTGDKASSPTAAAVVDTTSSGGTSADRSNSTVEAANEKTVLTLIADVFPDPSSAKSKAEAEAVIAPDAVAHGSGLTAGPSGLLDQFAAAHTRVANAQAVIKHEAADGDLVAVHWQVASDPTDERAGEAAVDLFRVTDGKIVERWSFSQPIATGTPASGNTNTMFSDLYANAAKPGSLTEAQEEQNRTFAVGAYNTLFRDQDVSVLDTSFDPNYLQHNAVAPNGTAALKGFFSGSTKFPPQESTISLSDGDLVWTFSQSVGAKASDPFLAADIFRVDDKLIREHWDVVPAS